MLRFFVAHGFDDSPALGILGGQAIEVFVEVCANLALGFGNETQAPFVAQQAARRADCVGAGVPDRTQATRFLAELLNALFAPGQVIEFLRGSVLHLLLNSLVASDRRVTLIQGLRSNFAGMVHAHETRRMRSLGGAQGRFFDGSGRIVSCRASCRRSDSAQCFVSTSQQAVDRGKFTNCHNWIIAKQRCLTVYSAAFFGSNPKILRRKCMKLRVTLIVAALLAPISLMAQEATKSPWSGKATLGYLATSGNTENSTLNTGVEVGFATGKWEHLAKAFAISASENKVTTAEAYELGWKSERNLTDKDFLFGRLDWRKDNFGAFDTQFSQTVGYGRRLIKTDRHLLNVEAGVGARQSELQNGISENETIFRGGAYYKWKFSETAEFRQDLTVESGSENTYSESITAVSAKLLGQLALVASYTVKHNSDVPALTEKSDTYTALSLEYIF